MAEPIRKQRTGKAGNRGSAFPLFPHPSGYWCKKVRGRHCYFGQVAKDPQGNAALELWLQQKDDLLAGRIPRPQGDGLTLRNLANRFLTSKRLLADSGEITKKTFADYYRACAQAINALGKHRLASDLTPEDLEKLRDSLPSHPVTRANCITRIRVLFKYAYDQQLIDRPIRYGQGFKLPTRRTMRKARAAAGNLMYSPEEIRALLANANRPMKAMVLLGINAAYGNTDVASLSRSAVDLKKGWADFPRPKTGIPRRCPLWPETLAAVKDALAKRPEPKDLADTDLVFITKQRRRWVRYQLVGELGTDGAKEASIDNVGQEFAKLLKAAGIAGRGRGFYSLRRTFQTIAEAVEQPATDHIMGHVREDMATVYRQGISDDRLRAVVNHVHDWLFGNT